jgi:hypothetical protein
MPVTTAVGTWHQAETTMSSGANVRNAKYNFLNDVRYMARLGVLSVNKNWFGSRRAAIAFEG